MMLEEFLKEIARLKAEIAALKAETDTLKRELDLLRNPNTFVSTRMGTIKIK